MHIGDKLSALLCSRVFITLPALCPSWSPSGTSRVRGPLWQDVVICCLAASPLGTEVLWGPQGVALCWARLWTRLLLGPPVCVPPHPLCLPVPQCSVSGILCFPPSLNFGMKRGLESGTLLSHVMNWGFDYAEPSGNREVAQGRPAAASGRSPHVPCSVLTLGQAARQELLSSDTYMWTHFSAPESQFIPPGAVRAWLEPRKRETLNQQDWRAGAAGPGRRA